jgi:parallel beta-helix repeat protein
MRSSKRNLYLAVPLAFAVQVAHGQTAGLPAETSARQAADTQLQNNINAETAARALGEARLQGNIDAEALARTAGDVNLQTQIDQLRNNGGNGGGTATVDCGAGQTVSQALASGAKQIVVRGTCRESVTITADDVTLQADPAGGRIDGPDAATNTVQVTGNRVTIDGLTVTGGRNGITGIGAANLTLRNCTVQSTGRNGISYANGSSGTVSRCTVQFNVRDGIAVDGAQATITESTVMNNRNGILVVNGGTSRIGVNDRLEPGGNTISRNGATGVSVSQGGSATIAMNTISDNGTDPSAPGRSGVGIFLSATADIIGGNTITGNAGPGVAASVGSTGVIGDAGFGLPSMNTIRGNGTAASGGGISAFLGTSLVVRDALIEQNFGPGIIFSTRSQGQMFGTTIRNNTSDGIRFVLGAGLLPLLPTSTVSGNAGFGVQCFDGESSVVNAGNVPSLPLFVSGNTTGDISAGCTAF